MHRFDRRFVPPPHCAALGGGLESSGPPSALDGGENEPARAAGPGFPPRRVSLSVSQRGLTPIAGSSLSLLKRGKYDIDPAPFVRSILTCHVACKAFVSSAQSSRSQERLSSGIPPPGSGQASSPFSRLSPPAAVKRVHRSALSGYAAPVLEDSEGERRALAQTSAADAGHQNVPPATTPRAKQRSLPAIGALAKRSNTDGGSIVKLGRDSPSATDTSGFISAERSDSSSDGIASRILYSAPWLVFVGATLVYSVSLLPLWTTWVMQSVTNRWMAANVAESLTLAAVYLADAVLIAVAQREGLVPPPHNRALSICMTCIDFLIPGILVVNAVAPYFVTEQLFAHGYTVRSSAWQPLTLPSLTQLTARCPVLLGGHVCLVLLGSLFVPRPLLGGHVCLVPVLRDIVPFASTVALWRCDRQRVLLVTV